MSAIDAYLSKPWLAHYTPGVPATVDVPDISVPRAFDEACRMNPQRTAIAFYGAQIKYGELLEASNRFAAALAALGIKKGDRVALYLLNSPQFVIAYFGALKAGAVVTPVR